MNEIPFILSPNACLASTGQTGLISIQLRCNTGGWLEGGVDDGGGSMSNKISKPGTHELGFYYAHMVLKFSTVAPFVRKDHFTFKYFEAWTKRIKFFDDISKYISFNENVEIVYLKFIEVCSREPNWQ